MKIGDYEIEGELGEGGMAKVYRAKHAFLETVHAIKVLDPEYRANAEARRRFLDEAKIQAKHLDHDNIVKVTNIVATDQHAALVMELVEGGSLETHLPELKNRPAEITRIMLGVLDAVGHAHAAGIIHRDLKPANVLLATEGGRVVPKVTDFGIAKVTDAKGGGNVKKSTHMASRMGTLGYMSPEQIRRAKDVTARSDIFSLGAMLYEMVTGELPFAGDSEFDVMENIVNGRYVPPSTRNPACEPRIAAVIQKAMAVDPAQRYASCADMAAALQAPSPTPKPTTPEPPVAPDATAPAAKSKGPLVAGLCLVGALGLGGAAFVMAKRGNEPPAKTPADASIVKPPSPASVTDFPENAETPPDVADTIAGGVRLLPLTGDGRYMKTPKLGDHVLVNLRIWTINDHKLVESNIGKPPVDFVITSDNHASDVLMLMTEHSSVRTWLAEPGKPAIVAEFELVEIKRWDPADKTFPAGADAPPSSALMAGTKTRYTMLADNTATLRSPLGDADAKLDYKMWRISDHALVDSNIGAGPAHFVVSDGMIGRSEVIQQMTVGDVARLWTEVAIDGGQQSPVLIEMELVSFTSLHCKGSYRSDEGLAITLTGDTSGPCGNYVFIDTSTPEKPMCSGRLSCTGASSPFACDYKGVDVHLEGKVSWLCEDDVLNAKVVMKGTTTPTPWKLTAVAE